MMIGNFSAQIGTSLHVPLAETYGAPACFWAGSGVSILMLISIPFLTETEPPRGGGVLWERARAKAASLATSADIAGEGAAEAGGRSGLSSGAEGGGGGSAHARPGDRVREEVAARVGEVMPHAVANPIAGLTGGAASAGHASPLAPSPRAELADADAARERRMHVVRMASAVRGGDVPTGGGGRGEARLTI